MCGFLPPTTSTTSLPAFWHSACVPVFAGDDVTDEAGFDVVQRLGGEGIKVGDGPSLARHRCPNPEALRMWLADALLLPSTRP